MDGKWQATARYYPPHGLPRKHFRTGKYGQKGLMRGVRRSLGNVVGEWGSGGVGEGGGGKVARVLERALESSFLVLICAVFAVVTF